MNWLSRNIKLGPKVLNNDVNQPPSPNTATRHTHSISSSNCVGEKMIWHIKDGSKFCKPRFWHKRNSKLVLLFIFSGLLFFWSLVFMTLVINGSHLHVKMSWQHLFVCLSGRFFKKFEDIYLFKEDTSQINDVNKIC